MATSLSSQVIADSNTGILDTASTAFVGGLTVLLVILAIFYASSAVKGHVNTSNTVEALFTGVDRSYLKGFTIQRPDGTRPSQKEEDPSSIHSSPKRMSRSLKFLQRQYDKIEGKVIRLVQSVNPYQTTFD